ncbi:hypothetical protein FF2_025908 [Malus domestica]
MKLCLILLCLQQPSFNASGILESTLNSQLDFTVLQSDRLQQNWKVKRLRMAASTSGNEGFTIDLFDNSLYDPAAIFWPSALSTVHVEHDSAGMLAINAEKKSVSDDECVKETHLLLREVHQAIFIEQVFNLVNREAFNQTLGVNVTGIQENYLQLNIGEGTSVFRSLIPSKGEQTGDSPSTQNIENAILPLDTLDGLQFPEDDKPDTPKKMSVIHDQISCEIYRQQIFHQHVFVKAKNVPTSTRVSGQPAKEGSRLLGHFCMSLAHRIFSIKVLTEMENVGHHICSCISTHLAFAVIIMDALCEDSLSIRHACQTQASDMRHVGNVAKSQLHTKVVVTDDCINVEGEGAPNMVGLFNGNSEEICSINRYNCNLDRSSCDNFAAGTPHAPARKDPKYPWSSVGHTAFAALPLCSPIPGLLLGIGIDVCESEKPMKLPSGFRGQVELGNWV